MRGVAHPAPAKVLTPFEPVRDLHSLFTHRVSALQSLPPIGGGLGGKQSVAPSRGREAKPPSYFPLPSGRGQGVGDHIADAPYPFN